MRFWDSSALVPLVVEEPTSLACRRVLRADSAIVVWALARVEVHSALRRLRRMRVLEVPSLRRAQLRLDRLSRRWDEVVALEATRDEAERLLDAHGNLNLRAADAVQLGAALVSCEGRPRRRAFVTLDDTLGRAAQAEGFDVITPGR